MEIVQAVGQEGVQGQESAGCKQGRPPEGESGGGDGGQQS
jgi:hypothetical protein